MLKSEGGVSPQAVLPTSCEKGEDSDASGVIVCEGAQTRAVRGISPFEVAEFGAMGDPLS